MGPKTQKTGSRRAARQQTTDFSRDLSLLITHANDRESLLARLLAETGITPAELVSLRKTDLDTRTRQLRLRPENTKNGQARTITLSTQLTRNLAAQARTHPHEHLFATRQSTQLSTRRVEQLIAAACERAGIPRITARDLRNNYLQAAAKNAKDNQELKELTGLKTITKDRALEQQEQARLEKALKKAPAREQALIGTLLETDMSLTQALGLRGEDISGLRISPRLSTTLRKLSREHHGDIFATRQSERLSTRRAEQLISAIGAKAKLRLSSKRLQATARNGGAP